MQFVGITILFNATRWLYCTFYQSGFLVSKPGDNFGFANYIFRTIVSEETNSSGANQNMFDFVIFVIPIGTLNWKWEFFFQIYGFIHIIVFTNILFRVLSIDPNTSSGIVLPISAFPSRSWPFLLQCDSVPRNRFIRFAQLVEDHAVLVPPKTEWKLHAINIRLCEGFWWLAKLGVVVMDQLFIASHIAKHKNHPFSAFEP